MADFSIPEILRVPLDSISLNVKATRENEDVKVSVVLIHLYLVLTHDSQAFLRKAIDPPQTSALDNAWNTLKELGAIDESNNITALGRHIVSFFQTRKVHYKQIISRQCFRLTLGSPRYAFLSLQSNVMLTSSVDDAFGDYISMFGTCSDCRGMPFLQALVLKSARPP